VGRSAHRFVGFLAHMPELMDFKRAVSVRVKMNNIDF
jgi:hypothetical protein